MLQDESLIPALPNAVIWDRTIDVKVGVRYLVAALDTVISAIDKRAPPPRDFEDKLWVLVQYDINADGGWPADLAVVLSTNLGVVSGWSFDDLEPMNDPNLSCVILRLKMATLYDMAR